MNRGYLIITAVFVISLFMMGCGNKPVNNTINREQGGTITINDSVLPEKNDSGKVKSNITIESLKSEKPENDAEKKTQNQPESADKTITGGLTTKAHTRTEAGCNEKLAWSVVRKKDHLSPAFEKKEAELANRYNGIYLGDTSKKVVYLTFDEGYENGYTSRILDTLKENNVKAAFFITMPYLKKEAALVDRMIKEGHIVGNHTVHHPSMPEIADDKKLENEMLDLDISFKEMTGKDMKYLRPPKGEFSERTLKISKNLGYRNVFWSFAYADWDVNKQKGSQYAYNIVIDNIHSGAILLLHAVSKDNTEALGSIIKELKAQGYTFGTLDDIK